MARHTDGSSAQRVAEGLGWFSIGLGLAQLVAPQQLAKLAGIRPSPAVITTLRSMGAREIVSGFAILANPVSARPVWSRVAGDAVDLALLSSAVGTEGGQRNRTVLATAAVAGLALADVLCAYGLSEIDERERQAAARIHAAAAVTVDLPVSEVYDFWQDFDYFPWFMRDLESVTRIDDQLSHWKVRGPGGLSAEWDAEIVSHQRDYFISWRSVPGSQIDNRGSVRFESAPGGRGTEVHVELSYLPPAGRVSQAAAWIFGRSPRQQLREGLKRVKQILELGDIPLSEGPGLSRPAQPPVSIDALKASVGVAS